MTKFFFGKSGILFLLPALFFIQAITYPQVDLRKKIAQMVIVGFNGFTMPDSLAVDLARRNLGGVIIMETNVSTPLQVASLAAKIKETALTLPIISIDQEGGKVARLNASTGFEDTYTALQLGTVFNSEDSTRKVASKIAGWLSLSGINLDFAPATDLNVNPQSPAIGHYERSFSSDPLVIAKHASYFIDELHKKNIITSIKHFPGHGSSLQDSHLGFTDITATWADSELVPYKSLFSTGYADLVMVGHLFNKNLDSVYPASISKNIITGMLRKKLGFNGVTISDDMTMRAISSNYSFDKSVELAVNAGIDILLYVTNLRNGTSLLNQIVDVVVNKVNAGVISEERINESYNRIMALKQRMANPSLVYLNKLKEKVLDSFTLQNYPNPFNPATHIIVKINRATFVSVKVYNVTGQVVANLANSNLAAGEYNFNFNGKNLSSGIYFVRLETPECSISKKIALLR